MSAYEADVAIHPVTAARWADLAQLFERPGPRGGRPPTAKCWCVIWRAPNRGPETNRRMLAELVEEGEEPGLLAYSGGEPVGWVSVAAQAQFASRLHSPQLRHDADYDDGLFVISCFAVAWQTRRQGIATALLSAAVEHARARGGRSVQGYPAQPPDYKGRLEWFVDVGFEPVRTVGKRTTVRLALR